MNRRALLVVALTAALAWLMVMPPASATPSAPLDPQPPPGIGMGQVIVLRPHRADLVSDGVVTRVVALTGGPVRMGSLVEAINDPSWAASIDTGVVRLNAGLLQRPGTSLIVSGLKVELADSATSPAYLAGTGASVSFSKSTLESWLPSGAEAARSPHRPYMSYSRRSTVSLVDSTFVGLGRSDPASDGVLVGSDSSLVARGARFSGGSTGLRVYRAASALIDDSSASDNAGTGIVIDQSTGVRLSDVTVDRNGHQGLELRGPLTGLFIAGPVNATANHLSGIYTSGLVRASLPRLTTTRNGTVGLVLDRCTSCTVSGLRSLDEVLALRLQRSSGDVVSGTVIRRGRAGVLVDGATTGTRLIDTEVQGTSQGVEIRGRSTIVKQLRVSGCSTGLLVAAPSRATTAGEVGVEDCTTGVRVAKDASNVTLTATKVHASTASGIAVGGTNVSVTGADISEAGLGVEVYGSAHGIRLSGGHIDHASTGLRITKGATDVAATGLTITNSTSRGVLSLSASLVLDRSVITGGTVGVDLHGGAVVTGTTISGVIEAVRAASHATIRLENDQMTATALGIRSSRTASVVIVDSNLQAPFGAHGPVSLKGHNRFPALPLHWLGIAALIALGLAATLELVRHIREQGHERLVPAPAHITNRS